MQLRGKSRAVRGLASAAIPRPVERASGLRIEAAERAARGAPAVFLGALGVGLEARYAAAQSIVLRAEFSVLCGDRIFVVWKIVFGHRRTIHRIGAALKPKLGGILR